MTGRMDRARGRVVIDARGARRALRRGAVNGVAPARPARPAKPGQLPRTMVRRDRRVPFAQAAQSIATSALAAYEAQRIRLPRPAKHSRTMNARLQLLLAIDVSGSTLSTDPANLRWWAARRVGRWMQRHHPNDRITVATFDEVVHIGRPRTPAQVARNPRAGLPVTHGGTAFMPIIDAALDLWRGFPEDGYGLVIVTDGMSGDAQQAADRLRSLDLHASICPFGADWPHVAATWEGVGAMDLYEHPGANLRQLARSIAFGVMSHTGEVPR